MARSTSLLASVPDGYGILFNRLIVLALSVAALAVYAATYTLYNARIESTGGHAPSHNTVLTANGLSLVPSAISIVCSIIHLSFLGCRLVRAHRRNGRPHEETDSRAVVHPIWLLLADFTCFALFVVAAVLTGVKSTKWKNGKVDYGSEGTRQVDLHACPTFDPVTGKLDYWCEPAWNQVVNLTNSGTSIMGTLAYVFVYLLLFPPTISYLPTDISFPYPPYKRKLANIDPRFPSHSGIHFTRFLYACYDLYLLRRHHWGGTHAKHCEDGKTADCHSNQTDEVKLERF